jgi:hypothetical protein
MSKIKRMCGLCLKSSDFTGANKNKCKVLALWGKYLAEEHFSEEESDVEECPLLEFSNADKENKRIETTQEPNEYKECKDEFVCDHVLDDTGYVSVRRVKNKTIAWNNGEVDNKGKILDDLELEWDKVLKVYLSTNESEDDYQTWLRILNIV